LVVIAIIAILAAILFPVFARARENARRTSCQNNLKQIALGVKQYIQDYDEKYPPVDFTGAASPDGSKGWTVSLQPYLKSTQIFQCGSDTQAPGASPTALGYTDYWYNGLLACQNEARFQATALTVLIGDGYGAADDTYGSSSKGNYAVAYNGAETNDGTPLDLDGDAFNYTINFGNLNTFNNTAQGPLDKHSQKHLEGANYSFADGHVKWYRPEKITNSASTAGNPTFRLK